MRYYSTRGDGKTTVNFETALLRGLAADGGLFLPQSVPQITARLAQWHRQGLSQIMAEIGSLYSDDTFALDLWQQLTKASYTQFRHPEITPLCQVGNTWVCELFHGPTFAFKDVAMQLLGRLFEHALSRTGENMTVLGATSGDTGAAAIHALGDRQGIEVFILYPKGRIGPLVERQMTCAPYTNTHAIAIEGDFDACQAVVKALFVQQPFAKKYKLAAINSINFVRVMVQCAYFFYAYFRVLEKTPGMKMGDLVRFCVPSGNFGHAWAGHLAMRMGLPIAPILAACNLNAFLEKAVNQGYCQSMATKKTHSPSMDIQAPSNFERYLYELSGNQPTTVSQWVQNMQNGFMLPKGPLAKMQKDFHAISVSNEDNLAAIREVYQSHHVLLDPHSAIGWSALKKTEQTPFPSVLMATAHAGKFPEAIEKALGHPPPKPPPELEALSALETKLTQLECTPQAIQNAIESSYKPL